MSADLFDRAAIHKFAGNVMYKGRRGVQYSIFPSVDIMPGKFDYFLYYSMYYKDGTVRKVCQKVPDLNYILRRNSEVIFYSCLLHDRPDSEYSPVKYYSLEMLIFKKNKWEFRTTTLRKTYQEEDNGLILSFGFSPFKNFIEDPLGLSHSV